ncbi:hypothetical protein HY992_05510 [Candidatus Micrarchaeota archaeon]|nr:hypothetical protein [Candidatus Micrarchaeota archaeon]
MSEEYYPKTPPNGTIDFVYLKENEIQELTALLNGDTSRTTENVSDFLGSLKIEQRIEASYMMLKKHELRASISKEDVAVLREGLEVGKNPYLRTLAVAAMCIVAEHAVNLIAKEDVEAVAKTISDEKLPQNSALLVRGIEFMEFIAVSPRQDELLDKTHVELLVGVASRMKDERMVDKVLKVVEKLVTTSAKSLLTEKASEQLLEISTRHNNTALTVMQLMRQAVQRFAPQAAGLSAVLVQGIKMAGRA